MNTPNLPLVDVALARKQSLTTPLISSTMTITKIVTHAGMFHADEILSIALLRVLGRTAPVERTFAVSEQDFESPAVCVLDVGKRLNPELSNFDHHQDGSLPATNMLLLQHLYHFFGAVATELERRLFTRVSDIDRGLVVLDNTGVPEFNMLIRSFNSLPDGFERAINVATEILTAQIETSRKALADESRWCALPKIGPIAYQFDTDVILCWKEKAKQEEILLLVCPNARGGYSVISRDTAEFVIPADEYQTFRHNSGFMATYPDYETASNRANAMLVE